MSAVLAAIAEFATCRPDEIALSDGASMLSWGDLAREVASAQHALAAALRERPEGAPVALALDNSTALAIADLALIALGRPSVTLPPFFTRAQLAHAVADCGATTVLLPATANDKPTLSIAGARLLAAPAASASRPIHARTAKITYTSGSTGKPKGVCLSLEQMETVASSVVESLGRDLAGVHMAVLPLGVLLENVAGLYVSILAGGRHHAPGLDSLGYSAGLRPDPARLADLVERHGVTSLILAPEMLRALTACLVAQGRRLPSLRFVAVGGARISPQLIAAARGAGLPAYEGYGLSECASVVTLNTPTGDKVGTAGRALPHQRITVASDGELIVHGDSFLGYVGGPPQQGVLPTGDLGAVDLEGFVEIRGRKSNLIITDLGRNVAPEWVESELQAQPEIGQAAVFGDGAAELCAVLTTTTPQVSDAEVARAVARANASLPAYAHVVRWRRSPPFDAARGELTANGRLRREALHAAHRDFIDLQAEDAR